MTSPRSRWILIGSAAFAMAWAIARAAVQSITIDEANSYIQYASRHLYLWYGANNHILNSTLMYGFTRLLGPSQFTARLPALLGAALYITASYRLCRLLAASAFVQLTVFACLVFNPFIFDYLVAARGYGLALGFLMWAIVYSAEEGPTVAACTVSSACAGMSVNANFAFAFVNLAAMTAILFRAWYERPGERIRLLVVCALPGTAIFAAVSGYALSHMHSGELIYGATSLRQTFGTIIQASLFRSPVDFLSPLVFLLVGITGLLWLFYSVNRIPPLGRAAAAIFAVTVAIHYVAFRMFGLLLPKDRTAIYFFPLFVIVAGALAAIPAFSRLGRYLRGSFVGSLAFMAIYFLLCLRMTYFKEWYWDADVHRTYAVISCLNREHQVTRVASTWEYRGPLNFYQVAQPNSIENIDDMFDPRQTQVYVVDTFHSPEALQGKDLKIFYRSPTTELVLAASPSLAAAYTAGSCLRL
ncbi:MAG: hypothetical protein ACRD4E_02285 [Bryobacteraceae bacterium]